MIRTEKSSRTELKCPRIYQHNGSCGELNPMHLACEASTLPYYKIKVPNVHDEVSSDFGLFLRSTNTNCLDLCINLKPSMN